MDDAFEPEVKRRSQIRDVIRKLCKSRTAVLGLCILSVLLLIVIFADFIADYDLATKLNMRDRLQAPSANHFFGTDEYGRDIFARVIHGSRISLSIALSVVLSAMMLGSIIGATSAYFGGVTDDVLMRFMDILLAIPGTILCIAIVAALGPGTVNMVIGLIVTYLPTFSRVARAAVLSIKRLEFVEAARAIGAKNSRIILKHLLLNAMGPITVQTTIGIASCILAAAGMSFLGLGTQPPTPEWGAILANGKQYLRNAPYILIFPGLFILFSTLSLNLLGDGLRDALDPKLRK